MEVGRSRGRRGVCTVLQGVESGKASLKTLTLGRANSVGGGKGGDENGPKRKLYAMVSETLRYKPLLDQLVVKADTTGTLFSDEHMREKEQGYIMLYEMLLGKGSIQGGGKLKRHLMQYKARLEECLAEAKVSAGLSKDASNESLLPKSARRHIFPRYARVNLVACPEGAKGVAAALQKEGYAAKVDGVVPSLLVLPPGTDLHDHAMVKDGRLVLQDKSSCFSAEALLGQEACAAAGATRDARAEWRGGDVIDACAAPGNKTMHAASLLHERASAAAAASAASSGGGSAGAGKVADRSNTGKRAKVFAFDKDLRRLALMRRRVDDSGASAGGAIETRLQDFLEVDPADRRYSKVTAILLDPSCSGSGIVSAPDRLHENQGDADEGEGAPGGDREEGRSRVARLAAFQLQGLLKAMSFPQVQRVCYSTCSVHAVENEDVVAKALDQQPTPSPLTTASTASASAAASSERFELSRCLSRWPRRGLAVSGLSKAQAACLARTDPFEDETNGFFVAVFERGVSSNGGVTSSGELGSGVSPGSCSGNGGGGGDGGAGVGGNSNGEPASKKKRNRHKNRKKNKKKRKLAEAEGKTQSEEAEQKEGAAEGCEEGNGEIGAATSIGATTE
ncbi:conserved unknown protein [Ectocarpus siliculosus]|uniref:SAM-dependent MTase RsmB/NOP-type domain-containing protein n=1 Tax=Ectocarpus siliculosus TaxID=2880 RepID=D8LQD8_ECTSI|nr:conserved unknown protein [Ectocarpus siliculosus]|eukprot:CBN78702.1 conserved unknown protein [Ectocarpus siliculosus]